MINSNYLRGEALSILHVLNILPIQCCLKFIINVQILLLIKKSQTTTIITKTHKEKQNNENPLLGRGYQRYRPIYPKKSMNNKSFQELPGGYAGPEIE